MAKPNFKDVDNGGLGDIGGLMSNAGVSDLSWLNVDPEEYRKLEALPKQNLDSIPELSRALAWDGKDERIPQLIPLRPHTVVNSNPLDQPSTPLRTYASVAHRVATYLMAGLPDDEIAKRVRLEFSPQQIAAESETSLALVKERGLIGNVYIAAEHFPRCAQEGPHRAFVAKHCPRSLYVVAKPECGGCVHNKSGRCASFKKEIVADVPYDQRTVAHYLPVLASEGRTPTLSPSALATASDRRAAVQKAFLSPILAFRDGGPMVVRHYAKPAPVPVTEADIADFRRRSALAGAADPLPAPHVLTVAKRMMEGSVDPVSLSASLDGDIRSLRSEHGVLGSTWLDGDALGGPSATAEFIRSRGSDPDFVLLRTADPADPAVLELGKTVRIVSSRPPVDRTNFERACRRAAAEGRMTRDMAESAVKNAPDGSDWIRLTSQANLFVMDEKPRLVEASAPYAGRAHHMGHGMDERTPVRQVDPEEIRRSITHMMNSGLKHEKLQASILSRYTRQELAQIPEVGERLGTEDGILGTYYVDPTAYLDYGRGCAIGAKAFRKQGAPYVLAASACTGCRLQTHPGWCSKYSKQMIRSVPDDVRRLASARRRLPVVQHAPVENPVEKFELASELTVDPAPARPKPLEISLGGPSVTD